MIQAEITFFQDLTWARSSWNLGALLYRKKSGLDRPPLACPSLAPALSRSSFYASCLLCISHGKFQRIVGVSPSVLIPKCDL